MHTIMSCTLQYPFLVYFSRCTCSPRPTLKERVAALVAALTDILWKAGQQKYATVAV